MSFLNAHTLLLSDHEQELAEHDTKVNKAANDIVLLFSNAQRDESRIDALDNAVDALEYRTGMTFKDILEKIQSLEVYASQTAFDNLVTSLFNLRV